MLRGHRKNCKEMSSTPALTVGYWAIRGLAAPLRMMALYEQTPCMCKMYECRELSDGSFDRSVWLADAKPTLKAQNPLMNLPYIIDTDADGNTVTVTQSNACMLYMGRKFGMLGDSPGEQSFCEQLLCEIMDLRNQMVGFAYSPRGSSAEESVKFFSSASVILDKLEAVRGGIAQRSAGPFFVGTRASAPDFHAWEMLDQLAVVAKVHSLPNPVAAFPLLSAFHRDFAALPGNAKYLASPLHLALPMNNPSAKVGAVPVGQGAGAWVPGQDFSWAGLSGTY